MGNSRETRSGGAHGEEKASADGDFNRLKLVLQERGSYEFANNAFIFRGSYFKCKVLLRRETVSLV